MDITLKGNAPAAMTAAILLITRARQLGFSQRVSVVGDAETMATVQGPALVYAPVLASCGVGREYGVGGTVLVPGPLAEPLLVSTQDGGLDGWFSVDRSGDGMHEATQAFTRLSNDPRVSARRLAKDIRRLAKILGTHASPGLLDVLFSAPVDPLTRLSLVLRAGRAHSKGGDLAVTRLLSPGQANTQEPIPPGYDRPFLEDLMRYGSIEWILDSLTDSARPYAEGWIDLLRTMARDDEGRDLALLYGLLELISHLAQLPPNSILPPLDAAMDGVAHSLTRALTVDQPQDANAKLREVFQFLGGRFVPEARYAFSVYSDPAPEGRAECWAWFCRSVARGHDHATALWPEMVDPAS